MSLLALSGYSQSKVSSDWKLIHRADTESYYFNTRSFKRNNSIVRTWIKIIYNSPRDGAVESQALTEFDCQEDLYNIQIAILYDSDLKVINRDESKANEYRPVPPDTIGSKILDRVCQFESY